MTSAFATATRRLLPEHIAVSDVMSRESDTWLPEDTVPQALARPVAHPRVLLVQPDRDDREMYVTYLRFHGATTLAVSTAAEALSLAPSSDVIVTGIRLPGPMDGLEFVRALRRGVTRHTPVIVLTACASRTDREQAFAAGCDRFLTKPCLPDILLAELKAARRGEESSGIIRT